MLGGDALGMELDAMDGQLAVAEAHHARSVETGRLAGGVDHEAVGNVLYHERVVARRGIGRGQSGKDTGAVMGEIARLAVHQPATHDRAAEMLADRLVAEAYAEQRLFRLCAGRHEVEADPRLIGCAGAGRDEVSRRVLGQRLFGGDGVVTHHFHLSPQFHQVMDQVEGEAVVIVDDEDGSVCGHCFGQWLSRTQLSSKQSFSPRESASIRSC